ncbi:MAG: transglycosylase SLT domain-containing protein [Deltaproteobacteria bacterium]|nr:transglycosylase SLT domain-containing protein [Deltaproteobacteria bacterium]
MLATSNPTPVSYKEPQKQELLADASQNLKIIKQANNLIIKNQFVEALTLIDQIDTPAAALLRARAWRTLGDVLKAEQELPKAAIIPELEPLVAIEKSLLALLRDDVQEAINTLAPLMQKNDPLVLSAIFPVAKALAIKMPSEFLKYFEKFDSLRSHDDPDFRSRLLGLKITALQKLGNVNEALATEKLRYIQEPVSQLTPKLLSENIKLSTDELLTRIDILLAANRNKRVVSEISTLNDSALNEKQLCIKNFALGLSLRKLRKYSRSESAFKLAVKSCHNDAEFLRRSRYLLAKVVSIRDGLRSLSIIDDFAKLYPNHSMTDDVLFWAGDILSRKGHLEKATTYYKRINNLKFKDDYCLEARWRLAWMNYRQNYLDKAKNALNNMLASDCSMTPQDTARGYYWLGRIAEKQNNLSQALNAYQSAFNAEAMGYYAQIALNRIIALDDKMAIKLTHISLPQPSSTNNNLVDPACALYIDHQSKFTRIEPLLALGLTNDAQIILRTINLPEMKIVSSTHAAALGVSSKQGTYHEDNRQTSTPTCERDLRLYLALLFDHAGAYQEAHWRLRTEFADDLSRWPNSETIAIWRAAYPLAWHEEIAAAESLNNIPTMLLQALAREESAFDEQVVSWAGAYGLTQLLLSTARDAGRLLKPPLKIQHVEELLDANLNTKLGGAFLASLIKHYHGCLALALCAYNAGNRAAKSWWKRFGTEGLDVLVEEISIQETRGYVKRVLRSYGVYLWLYKNQMPNIKLKISSP